MTVQEARKELKSYRKLLDMRKKKNMRIEELRTLLYRCPGSRYGNEIKSRNPYLREELIDKIDKAEQSYVQSIAETVGALETIERKIEKLEERHYKVLWDKYIEGKTYELIAVQQHYTYQWVRELEVQGVNQYAKL